MKVNLRCHYSQVRVVLNVSVLSLYHSIVEEHCVHQLLHYQCHSEYDLTLLNDLLVF